MINFYLSHFKFQSYAQEEEGGDLSLSPSHSGICLCCYEPEVGLLM